MDLIDVIKRLDESIRAHGSKGHLLFSKQILPTEVNVYKEVVFKLWYKNSTDTKEILILKNKIKLPSSKKDEILNELSLQFMGMLFNYIQGDMFKEIVYGREIGVEAE